MTSFQKTIKYCAIIFAGLLAISIIGSILGAIFGGVSMFTKNENRTNIEVQSNGDIWTKNDFSGIKEIQVDGGINKIVIEEKTSIKKVEVVTTGEDDEFDVRSYGTILKVDTNDDGFLEHIFSSHKNKHSGTVTISIPVDKVLKRLEIESGVGTVRMTNIKTDELDIDAGVGNIVCDNIKANCADIDGGVGKLLIDNVNLNGLDLAAGVGKVDISGNITGDIDIDGGVGEIHMKINGNKESYNIKTESGIGGIYINGQKSNNVHYYNDNQRGTLNIYGGVGPIKVDFN